MPYRVGPQVTPRIICLDGNRHGYDRLRAGYSLTSSARSLAATSPRVARWAPIASTRRRNSSSPFSSVRRVSPVRRCTFRDGVSAVLPRRRRSRSREVGETPTRQAMLRTYPARAAFGGDWIRRGLGRPLSQAWPARCPTAPRRPTQPMHPTQSTQSTHPMQPTQRVQFTQARVATHRCRPTPKKVSTLARIPRLPPVAALPATATLPAVAALPATATLPAVATLPATATLPAVATLRTTPTLPVVATPPATATLAVVATLPATATLSTVTTLATEAVPSAAEGGHEASRFLRARAGLSVMIHMVPKVAAAVQTGL